VKDPFAEKFPGNVAEAAVYEYVPFGSFSTRKEAVAFQVCPRSVRFQDEFGGRAFSEKLTGNVVAAPAIGWTESGPRDMVARAVA
jgi:hypothetical protein